MVSPTYRPEDEWKEKKIHLEDMRKPTDFELEEAGKTYADFYKWRDYRSGALIQFQRYDFETVLKKSRELFWNALITPSDDLGEIGVDFALPYVRKEVMQFVSGIVSNEYRGRFNGDTLDIYGVKVLQGIYEKWRFKSNDKVEKFWELLYGVVNGTVCDFIGYNNGKMTYRYLRGYDKESSDYHIVEKEEPLWDDVWSELVPIEDMYMPKIYERNFQKQGRCIWKTEIEWNQFRLEFKDFDNAEYVYPGNMIAEDSLYYRLLSGSGVLASNKVQLLKKFVWAGEVDKYIIYANGVLLNPIGKGRKQTSSPMPWDHKMAPFAWSQMLPLDEKLAWGIPLPFLIKEPHKILNVTNVMLLEHELRNVSPAVLSSDFDAPKIIYGRHDVIPVNDVAAYKELKLSDPSNAFFQMMVNIKSEMSDTAQGGAQPIMPSRQPKSAQEVIKLNAIVQQAKAITLLMYYNMLRQQMLLVIKTALQFYPLKKYKKQQANILRAINVPNMALTSGGVGTLHIRLTKGKPKDQEMRNLELFYEAINMSMMNGRTTEIIEAPADVIQNIEFEITDIDMEPAQNDEMRKQAYVEQVIKPMIETYAPAGIADLGKTFLRHMEKMGEHPMDFANEKVLAQVMSMWGEEYGAKPATPEGGAGKPSPMGGMEGNLKQSGTGVKFGSQNNPPLPLEQ